MTGRGAQTGHPIHQRDAILAGTMLQPEPLQQRRYQEALAVCGAVLLLLGATPQPQQAQSEDETRSNGSNTRPELGKVSPSRNGRAVALISRACRLTLSKRCEPTHVARCICVNT